MLLKSMCNYYMIHVETKCIATHRILLVYAGLYNIYSFNICIGLCHAEALHCRFQVHQIRSCWDFQSDCENERQTRSLGRRRHHVQCLDATFEHPRHVQQRWWGVVLSETGSHAVTGGGNSAVKVDRFQNNVCVWSRSHFGVNSQWGQMSIVLQAMFKS